MREAWQLLGRRHPSLTGRSVVRLPCREVSTVENWTMTALTTTVGTTQTTVPRWPLGAGMPLVILPVAARLLTAAAPRWLQMWSLAVSIYGGLKWLSFAASPAARDATA